MAKQRLVEKNYEITENTVKITETVEKELTAQDLLGEKKNYQQKQAQIIQQMNQLKAQYDAFGDAILEIDEMLSNLPEVEFVETPRMPPIPLPSTSTQKGG